MANARFQTNAVDALIDSVLKAGFEAGNVREHLWQVAWARGYQDVAIPMPMPETKVEGHVVLSRVYGPRHTLLLIDDTERLVGFFDEFREPAPGSKVRIVPTFGPGTGWQARVLASLGCGLQISFDDGGGGDSTWIDRLRHCLATIREEERLVRKRIEHERASVVFVTPPKAFRTEMEAADKEIRERVLAGGYTDEEKTQLARAKTPEAMQKLVAARNARLVNAYRAEVMQFRARIPELRAAYDKEMDRYAAYRNQVDRLNEADAVSRSVTDTSQRLTGMLDTIEAAVLKVRPVGLSRIEENPRAAFAEITQTIDLLFDLVPKRIQQQRAAAASMG